MAEIRLTCTIAKQAPDQRRFWGKAYIHTLASGDTVEDYSGDVIDTPEAQAALEEAFYGFVKDYRTGDTEHSVFASSTLIEGFVVTKEKIAAGLFPDGMDEGIYVGFEANDTPEGHALWDGIKTGRLPSFSIVGEGDTVTV